jgi:hypothetical protein
VGGRHGSVSWKVLRIVVVLAQIRGLPGILSPASIRGSHGHEHNAGRRRRCRGGIVLHGELENVVVTRDIYSSRSVGPHRNVNYGANEGAKADVLAQIQRRCRH